MARDVDAWLIDLDGTLYKAGLVKLGMAAELLLGGLTVAPVLRRFRPLPGRGRRPSTPAAPT